MFISKNIILLFQVTGSEVECHNKICDGFKPGEYYVLSATASSWSGNGKLDGSLGCERMLDFYVQMEFSGIRNQYYDMTVICISTENKKIKSLYVLILTSVKFQK